jgi:hypothetical protein
MTTSDMRKYSPELEQPPIEEPIVQQKKAVLRVPITDVIDAASLGTIRQLVNLRIPLDKISPPITNEVKVVETPPYLSHNASGLEWKWHTDILGKLFAKWFDPKN